MICKVALLPIFTHLIEYVVNNFNFYKLCILYFQFCRIKVYILSIFLFQFQHSVCAIFIRIFTTLDTEIKIDFTYLWVKESIETNQLFGYIMLIEYKINEFRITFFLLIYLSSYKMCSFFTWKKIVITCVRKSECNKNKWLMSIKNEIFFENVLIKKKSNIRNTCNHSNTQCLHRYMYMSSLQNYNISTILQ